MVERHPGIVGAMDTLVYTLITPMHEANADGNIAAV